MAAIDITVLLATHNGGDVLRRTLQRYEHIADADLNWQIIVVDNASTDTTPDTIRSFEARLPLLHLSEQQAGKNAALNTGLGAVDGDIVILTDDDALPEPGFLRAWYEGFQKWPEADLFGGQIRPLFDVDPPAWFLEEQPRFDVLYSQVLDLPDGPVDPQWIFGPNMAVRRRLFDDGLRFEAAVGPNHGEANYSMGSESEFCLRAVRAGYQTAFISGPMVQHIVRPHQIQPEFWWRRAYKFGRGIALRQWQSGELQVSKGSIVKQSLRPAFRMLRLAQARAKTLELKQPERFYGMWNYHFRRGFQDEVRRLRRSGFSASA